METTYKYVHLDRTNLRAEMEQGALEGELLRSSYGACAARGRRSPRRPIQEKLRATRSPPASPSTK
jgi:hypothetical protein